MERRLVHWQRHVVAASGDVQEIAGLEDLIELSASRRLRTGFQVGAVQTVHRGSVEDPPLSSVHLEDEYFLIVPMKIEAVQGTPRRVDVDLGAPAEEHLE